MTPRALPAVSGSSLKMKERVDPVRIGPLLLLLPNSQRLSRSSFLNELQILFTKAYVHHIRPLSLPAEKPFIADCILLYVLQISSHFETFRFSHLPL